MAVPNGHLVPPLYTFKKGKIMRLLTIEEIGGISGAGEDSAPAAAGSIVNSTGCSDPAHAVGMYESAVAAATDLIEWVANQF